MPALDSYGWRQKNPWFWGVPYGSQPGGTGGGTGGGGVGRIEGPFNAFGTQFWINTANCRVGFDVDTDPDPDVFLTGQQVCDADIEQRVKLAVHSQLIALNCDGLPCIGGQ